MNESILAKLEQMSMRLEEVGAMLSDPSVASDAKKFREALGKGDKVITIGGIHGKIIEVKEQYVQIQIANGVEIKVSKSAVSPEMTSGSGESELQKK